MDHLAIMRKSWGLTPKLLSGKKTIESRWYKARYPPWDRIGPGDTVYFKDSGSPVTVKAGVCAVKQFSGLDPKKVRDILDSYGREDGLEQEDISRFYELFRDKRYCILVFLRNPERTGPFDVDKAGFGTMSAWITIQDISSIRKRHP